MRRGISSSRDAVFDDAGAAAASAAARLGAARRATRYDEAPRASDVSVEIEASLREIAAMVEHLDRSAASEEATAAVRRARRDDALTSARRRSPAARRAERTPPPPPPSSSKPAKPKPPSSKLGRSIAPPHLFAVPVSTRSPAPAEEIVSRADCAERLDQYTEASLVEQRASL